MKATYRPLSDLTRVEREVERMRDTARRKEKRKARREHEWKVHRVGDWEIGPQTRRELKLRTRDR